MNKPYPAIIISFLLLCLASEAFSQQALVSEAKRKDLSDFSARQQNLYLSGHQRALALAKSHGWVILRKTKNGGLVSLQGVNSLGFPIYLITDDNVISAATTQTNTVQPGGDIGVKSIRVKWFFR